MRLTYIAAPSILALAVAQSGAAWAQEAAPAPPAEEAPAPQASVVPAASAGTGAQVYEPAFFARYSPRNALDMVKQIPGFLIRDPSQGGGPQRGLGQANANVLVNGERLAGKSDGVENQLARIPADSVTRIEIVDGATLAIPGLSGQVANIIVKADQGLSGQFRWNPEFRAHFAEPSFLGGEVSIKGASGPVEYSASLSNDADRGAFGGPFAIYDGTGALSERRDGALSVYGENPKVTAGVKLDGPGSSVGNLNASYRRTYFNIEEDEQRDRLDLVDLFRTIRARERGYDYEITGDYEFALGPGRLKLIGLERFNRNHYAETARFAFADARPEIGDRYMQDVDAGERIARAEYSWKLGGADLQWASEAAFNRLTKEAALFELGADNTFVELPFPGGDGGVTEDRYETVLSYSRPLTSKLSLQSSLGWEYSKIAQTGAAMVTRSFWRPKGSATLAWAPEAGLDITLKVERKVGQLEFSDFLARVFLDDGNQNSVNADLVPSQSWDTDLTIKKALGRWGSTNLRLFDRRTEDFVDIVPLPGGGEGRGNIDRLHRFGLEWTSTINLDPLGVPGAKIDANVILQHSSLKDPLTGETRQLSQLTTRLLELDYRHDIPGSDWAYGASLFTADNEPYFRLFETGRESEGPVFADVFVEHKDVFGLTVNARVGNIFNARHKLERIVYTGFRDRSPIAFIERREQLIGPIFSLSVKGEF